MSWKTALFCALACALSAAPSFAEDFIGGLRNVKGSGTIVRNGEQIAAQDGIRIKMGDSLITGGNGAMGVVFSDNTRISLGPNSEIRVDRYVYNPGEGVFSFMTSMARGTVSYISGIIAKLAPDSVHFRTPTASVGIRGTHFLVKIEP